MPGERAEQGVTRLPGLLRQHAPQVVLLMEGANDLNTFGGSGVRRAADALEAMLQEARCRGVRAMLATLPPQRPGSRSGQSAHLIEDYNALLRHVAADEGAIVVDVFAAFGNDLSLIGADGLHPTENGYERIAQAFFDSIKTHFEAKTTVEPGRDAGPTS